MTAVGDYVEVLCSNDVYAPLEPGDRGPVTLIDDGGTVWVEWESGRSLGLAARGGDRWRVIPAPDKKGDSP